MNENNNENICKDFLYEQDDLELFSRDSERNDNLQNTIQFRDQHIKLKDQGYSDAFEKFKNHQKPILFLIGFLTAKNVSANEVNNFLYEMMQSDENIIQKIEEIIKIY